ncbi:hypothetical protein PCAR4_140125 [Paraburkholderia caribensis]|nr:hypothetical protein PCAR4_140125 [Paraburkholderia caribensis]
MLCDRYEVTDVPEQHGGPSDYSYCR